MDEFKLELKAFLKRYALGYTDVANVALVSETTVRNWMAQKKIPAAKKKVLEIWMSETTGNKPASCPEEKPQLSLGQEAALLLKKLHAAYPDVPADNVTLLVMLAMRDAL